MTRPGSARRRPRALQRSASRLLGTALVMAAAASLAACGSISDKFRTAASQAPGIGLPAGAPERPTTPPAYPAVHDLPAPRNSVILTGVEQAEMERSLTEARDQQQATAGVKLPPSKSKKEKEKKQAAPALRPGSGASIY